MPGFALQLVRGVRLRLPQPWSLRFGQLTHLRGVVTDAATRRHFAEEALIEHLVTSGAPLRAVGPGLSERVIEIPWVVRRLSAGADRVLDVGTAYAPTVYHRLLVRHAGHVQAVDLAPCGIPGLPSCVADIRALPFESQSFDVAACISTLEHIGLDNSTYGIESGGSGDVAAA
jgi:hypothetical protein